MLPPFQQSTASFAADQLRSMLDDMEARRKEAEDKAAGKDKDDRIVGATPDPVSAAANAKINAHFFGSLKVDPDALVKLIARFASALGIQQNPDETSFSFARRLGDAVTMLAFGKTHAGGEPVKITLKSLGATQDEVASILKGTATGEQNPMAEMAARIARDAGLTGEEDDFGEQMSFALMAMRSTLPEDDKALEKMTGLKDLGLTAQDMLDAIANPWSDAARKVKNALSGQAEGRMAMTREMKKVIQRLEDVADPKTAEELKLRDTKSEPGRVEDTETKAERKQDIQNLDNAEKLEDVREQQDAVKEHLEDAESAGDGTTATDGSLQIIQVLASQSVKHEAGDDGAVNDNSASSETAAESLSEAAPGSQAEREVRDILQLSEAIDREGILVLPVDDIGIYELLRRKAA
ncbi:hypothetical protein IB238_16430 [Rhizobium sp. ARZ01]|uniref:hypothetical protein n=1 Tax=Rhizobium sp. ARZ01 TaxID=2769313 RepID=UPI00177F052C|nr:hypothetical protein [Rhizobium sp. ARZ01]MBD9374210.1 hypothetical protein [Rhizobium sp. ARZ01]